MSTGYTTQGEGISLWIRPGGFHISSTHFLNRDQKTVVTWIMTKLTYHCNNKVPPLLTFAFDFGDNWPTSTIWPCWRGGLSITTPLYCILRYKQSQTEWFNFSQFFKSHHQMASSLINPFMVWREWVCVCWINLISKIEPSTVCDH